MFFSSSLRNGLTLRDLFASIAGNSVEHEENMDFFHGPNYRISKYFLAVLGLWPLQKRRDKFFFRSLTIFAVGSILVPKIIKFVEYYGDFNGMIQCFPVLALHSVGLFKFGNYWINAKTLRSLTRRIEEDWMAQRAEHDEVILTRYAERGRIYTIAYGVYLYATLSVYLLLPAIPIVLDVVAPLNQSRQLIYLYETQYFVDPDEYYFYILAHAYLTMPFSLTMVISFDTMFAVYVHHACGLFSTLGSHLEAIGHDVRDEKLQRSVEFEEDNRDAYKKIVKCVNLHKRVLEFVRIMQSSSSTCLLFVTGLCTMIITLTGFMAVTHLDEPGEALRFGSFGLGAIIHMFYTCWLGQMLVDHSEQVFSNAYNVIWYNLANRTSKLPILIMMRSSVSCKISAGKVFDMSLPNFSAALKTSMSYFTVLLSMQ